MWDPPGQGIEPVSPALADRFFTTEPPGKPRFFFFFNLDLFLDGLIFCVVLSFGFLCHTALF